MLALEQVPKGTYIRGETATRSDRRNVVKLKLLVLIRSHVQCYIILTLSFAVMKNSRTAPATTYAQRVKFSIAEGCDKERVIKPLKREGDSIDLTRWYD